MFLRRATGLGVLAASTSQWRRGAQAAQCSTGTIPSSSGAAGRQALTDLSQKVVLITGASGGIGEACAYRFAELDSKLVLVGRRSAKLQEVKSGILARHPGCKILCITLDVADPAAIMALPGQLEGSGFADVCVLVNNAGLALGVGTADAHSVADMETVMNTNVLGLMTMCRAFLPGMKTRGEGHVVNMGSVAGLHAYTTGSLYCASKFAVAGFTSSARHDLVATPIRVTHIAPGMVSGTEFSVVRMGGDESKAKAVYADIEALSPEDVADNVVYACTRPRHVQIAEIVMYATNQAGPRDVARVGPSMGKA